MHARQGRSGSRTHASSCTAANGGTPPDRTSMSPIRTRARAPSQGRRSAVCPRCRRRPLSDEPFGRLTWPRYAPNVRMRARAAQYGPLLDPTGRRFWAHGLRHRICLFVTMLTGCGTRPERSSLAPLRPEQGTLRYARSVRRRLRRSASAGRPGRQRLNAPDGRRPLPSRSQNRAQPWCAACRSPGWGSATATRFPTLLAMRGGAR
jgi:hypothetical protein